MLSSTLLRAFTTPVTYVLIVILLGTAILQVRYVNRALEKFDSTQVIPIQFVSFTLCVIIGSAVLYRDFERTTAERAIKFIGGCGLTFFGVFLITSGRPPAEGDDEEMLSDDEGIEETIGLAEQDLHSPPSPGPQTRRDSATRREGGARSRRSSKVSFKDAVNKPLPVLAEAGVPTPRTHGAASSRASLPNTGEATESAPLLRTPSREGMVHPGIQHAMSSDSAVTISSATPIYSEPGTHPSTPLHQESHSVNIPQDGSVPRASTSAPRPRSRHFTSHLFSPSPFDSTVRGLVPSTLLKDSPIVKRPISKRRLSRPSLRSSLYVSQDDLNQGEDEEIGTMSAIERSRTADTSFNGDSPIEGPTRHSLRNRAKSLTHAVGDLFGTNKKRDTETNGESGGRRQTNDSIETL